MNNLFLFLLAMLVCTGCKTPKPQDPVPTHDTINIESGVLRETRIINIWKPATMRPDQDLPVLYMPDGGINEDFPHIANTVSSLVSSGKIPPVILVGIANTERRRDLTGFTSVEEDKKVAPVTGGADNFRQFIREELFPEINKKYPVNNYKGIIGESLAGLFVMETFFSQPDMFDFYIAFDPSLWWNDHYLVRTAGEHLNKLRNNTVKKIWFAGSDATDINVYTRELAGILNKYSDRGILSHYSDEPGEKHNTIFRATKEKALVWALNK